MAYLYVMSAGKVTA